MDRDLFGEPRADRYLKTALPWLTARWKSEGSLPAVIGPSGKPLADHESLEMLSALMVAWHPYEPEIARAAQRRVQGTYKSGFWGDADSYYIQNWAWFGTALYEGYLGPLTLLK